MTKGRRTHYSEAELAWIHRNRALPRKEAHRRYCEKFGRKDVSLNNYNALCKRKGWFTGRDGRIAEGTSPWNKGEKCAPGKGGNHPNAKKTQFKPGTRQGVATKLYKPIGTERVSKDGYLERKVNDGMPLQARWRAVHLVRWEEVNGPLPRGMCMKCLDGDRGNTDPDNWVAIPRGALPFLNGHRGHNYEETPHELKPAVLALARLKHAKSKAAKRNKDLP
jgi:HNH endonuclease